MRRLLAIFLLPALTTMVFAADAPPPTDQPAHHKRLTWEEHFAAANQTHDGHLTLEEAKNGFPTIARKFSDIDVDGKGYVTENDIRAWRALQKAGRHQPAQPEDPMRPRPAFQQHTFLNARAFNTSTSHVVATPQVLHTPPALE